LARSVQCRRPLSPRCVRPPGASSRPDHGHQQSVVPACAAATVTSAPVPLRPRFHRPARVEQKADHIGGAPEWWLSSHRLGRGRHPPPRAPSTVGTTRLDVLPSAADRGRGLLVRAGPSGSGGTATEVEQPPLLSTAPRIMSRALVTGKAATVVAERQAGFENRPRRSTQYPARGRPDLPASPASHLCSWAAKRHLKSSKCVMRTT